MKVRGKLLLFCMMHDSTVYGFRALAEDVKLAVGMPAWF